MAERRQRVLPVLIGGLLASVTTNGAEVEPYGLFDFLGDMVEVEGELVDPMLFELDESQDTADAMESGDEMEMDTQTVPETVEVG